MKKKAINETTALMGRALFVARQTNRLSHADAADILGITTDDLLQYERGRAQVSIEVLEHMFAVGYKMIGLRKLEKSTWPSVNLFLK